MNREDIIRMAREAEGFAVGYYKPSEEFVRFAERFAALVAAAERERLAQSIEQMPFGDTATSFAVYVRNFK